MTFIETYMWAFPVIMTLMTLLWIISVMIKNASIVDPVWGLGFIIVSIYYLLMVKGFETRQILVVTLVGIWGLRLSAYLFWRNIGKGEDFRYKQFRKNYGEHRYWWVSFFQVFLLQGVLLWLISAPVLGAIYYSTANSLNIIDLVAIIVWLIGFAFEAGGDYQLVKFKSRKENKGKILKNGFWKYTRHPNYFGDAAVWWGFGLFAIASGAYPTILGSLLMTGLLVKVSGVAMLEKSMKNNKPGYEDYIQKTSAFLPRFPK